MSPSFHRQRHIKYWLRCLHTLLPTEYTSTDTSRLSLAFFILSALDLLSSLEPNISPTQRESFISWIYRCQHENGGFRGSPATALPASALGGRWDTATLPSTFFALASLSILGDPFERVKKIECLRWIKGLQEEGGGFRELQVNGQREGGCDPRTAYAAAGIRWFLLPNDESQDDFDVNALTEYIQSCQSFDHGYGGGPRQEAHAGLTYCSLGTIAFLDCLPPQDPRLIDWLVSRQTPHIQYSSDSESDDESIPFVNPSRVAAGQVEPTSSETTTPQIPAGFAGRPAKLPDTCYSFWVGASLGILDSHHLINSDRDRDFLLGETQGELTGGFAKAPGAPPDILHSFLGLAALAIDEDARIMCELKRLNPVVCISEDVLRKKKIGRRIGLTSSSSTPSISQER